MMWDDTVKKNVGIFLWSLIFAGGFVLFEVLRLFELSPIMIFFAEFVWYASDALIASIMWHYFKVKKSDVPIPGNVILTPVENSEVSDSTIPEVITE